jgi:uncharacterized protein YbjT (DUF2867 family)
VKILVTGATGYIGGAAAKALRLGGHEVSGLACSERAAAKLTQAGLTPVMGDFADAASKTRHLTGWAPTRTDILHDLEFGSYAA